MPPAGANSFHSQVVLDAKANRLVVEPNHEAAAGMEVDSDEDGYDDIEVEEVDD